MNDLSGLGTTFIPSTICRIGLIELTAKEDGWMSQVLLFCCCPLPLRRKLLKEDSFNEGEDESVGVDGSDAAGDSEDNDGEDGEGFIVLTTRLLSMMVIRNYFSFEFLYSVIDRINKGIYLLIDGLWVDLSQVIF